jgi:hypothetical protein
VTHAVVRDVAAASRAAYYPAAFWSTAARTWLIAADDEAAGAMVRGMCDRPELRPLLQGVSIIVRSSMRVPYRVVDPATIELDGTATSNEALTLLSLRHALEIAMWRQILPPDATPAQTIASAALAVHAMVEYMRCQPPEVAADAVDAAPSWLSRLLESPLHEDGHTRAERLVALWPELLPLHGLDVSRAAVDERAVSSAAALVADLAPAARPAERLLTLGGDSRLRIDSRTRLNKYGCSPAPRPDAVTFSSCTATSASDLGFASAETARRGLLAHGLVAGALASGFDEAMHAVRRELAEMFGVTRAAGAEVVLAASGTDCELLALELALCGHDRAVTNIVVGPDEIGSGSVAAAEGRHFDSMAPLAATVGCGTSVAGIQADRVRVERVPLRDPNGVAVPLSRLDAEVTSIVDAAVARGDRVLLHLLDGSKTGLRAPSVSTTAGISSRQRPAVDVVVDGAQLRTADDMLTRYLDAGFMVIVTGSKFYTGSPFAGALLVPQPMAARLDRVAELPAGLGVYLSRFEMPPRWQRLRSRLPAVLNLGLLLRWQAALHEIRAFAAVSRPDRRRYLEAFRDGVVEIIARHPELASVDAPVGDRDATTPGRAPAWDEVRTIFTFFVRRGSGAEPMAYEEAWDAYCWLNRDVSAYLPARASAAERSLAARACHIGQPVRLSATGTACGALRIAVGARFVSRIAFDGTLGPHPEARVAAQLADVKAVLAKLSVLLRYWNDVARSASSAA